MTGVFADTSSYQALLNPRDAWHANALRFSHLYEDEIITTEYVLVELGALLSRPKVRPLFVELIGKLRSDPCTHIIPASAELFDAGFALFAQRCDKEWSLTDCISFVVMAQHRITDAIGTDRHFEQAGFRLPIL